MLEYSPSLLGDLNCGGGSFARSHDPTAVYIINDSEILSRLRRHTVYPITKTNIALLSTMPRLNSSNRINKIALSALDIGVSYDCLGRLVLFWMTRSFMGLFLYVFILLY